RVWAVRERHDGGTITRHIVAVPVDGSAADDPSRVREVVGGSHFLSDPRPSPDGRRIAWLAWEQPDMPWDATELRLADLDENGVASSHRVLLGGPLGQDATDPGERESVFQPEWAGTDALYAVADRTGWWNLYRVHVDGGEPAPLCPRDEEFGLPQWQLGFRSYAVLDDGRIAALHSGPSGSGFGLLDPASGKLTDLDLAYTDWAPHVTTDGRELTSVAASPYAPGAVVRVDPAAGAATEVRASTDADALPDAAYLPDVEEVTLTGPGGRDVHANVYPPKNPRFAAPEDERPPFVVFVHGGPTAQSGATLNLTKAYFTSRGIGVVDVNYGGSTGYGRAYRERLRGQWGIVDVEDCVAAARALADRGRADPDRLAIRGGSAGGWTVLAALTSTDAFACGASYFGVAELLTFAETTHDFESRYLDGLIGKLPEDRQTYVDRAPLSHVDDVSCPVLLLQGLEDAVVPPSQGEMFREALARKGIPHAYLAFEGEQHGFRKAATIVTATEAELSFYGQVMGFDPPGVPRLALEGGTA
ncbi:MAG: S9 family peptidase, partial [Streptosporangiales bacterium]|nr:S9 family peptidase [Streptosporangiales bacterium]